jgi:predicted amidohydrolase
LCFGVLICNDLWVTPGCGPYPDPRLSYQLGRKGARVIFHAVGAPGGGPKYRLFHEGNHLLRAIESRVYIPVSNITGPASQASVRVGIVTPQGEWLVAAPFGKDAMVIGDVHC